MSLLVRWMVCKKKIGPSAQIEQYFALGKDQAQGLENDIGQEHEDTETN